MKRYWRLITFGLTLVYPLLAFSGGEDEKQEVNDINKDSVNIEAVLSPLDSLLIHWYTTKQTYDTNREKLNIYGFKKGKVPAYSDSILENRLNKIEQVITLSYNSQVKAFIDLYTKKRRDQMELMLGLKEYYFPIFEQELDRAGLPLELKYLPVIESALNPNAQSWMGAKGLWQFMYRTAKNYHLKITSFIDERKDPKASTQAAVSYLKDLHKIYGDWLMVIAAYNCGPGNVNKAIRRSGFETGFWSVYPYLPRETRGYVPAFIAANYAMHFHIEHNLYPRSIDIPLTSDTVQITKEVHFKSISRFLGISTKIIKMLNPRYIRNYIPAGHHPQSLRLPLKHAVSFQNYRDSIYNFSDSLKADKKPKWAQKAQKQKQSFNNKFALLYYKVKQGDNLGFIAEWYDCRASDLRRWNKIRGNFIHAGKRLTVYVSREKVEKYRKINQLSFAQKQKIEQQQHDTIVEPDYQPGNFKYYTVQQGDTLWKIARKFQDVSLNQLKELNNIENPGTLKPGQKIKIKEKG